MSAPSTIEPAAEPQSAMARVERLEASLKALPIAAGDVAVVLRKLHDSDTQTRGVGHERAKKLVRVDHPDSEVKTAVVGAGEEFIGLEPVDQRFSVRLELLDHLGVDRHAGSPSIGSSTVAPVDDVASIVGAASGVVPSATPDALSEAGGVLSGMQTTVTPFNHNREGEEYTGHRGVIVEATTGFSGSYAFSSRFPTVFISDIVDVEIDEHRLPAEETIQWLEAVAAAIREQLAKQANS